MLIIEDVKFIKLEDLVFFICKYFSLFLFILKVFDEILLFWMDGVDLRLG
jgi:hypothetical protein